MRVYDPRIGKFLSVDPLTNNYAYYTPYQYAGNDVIRNTDVDGGEPKPTTTMAIEGQTETTSEDRLEGKADLVVTHFQNWVYHEGGVNGSKAGWMKQESYFENILKPLAKDFNDEDYESAAKFSATRHSPESLDYFGMVKGAAKYIRDNPTYDSWAKWGPIWGSYQQAKLDYSVNKYWSGGLNTAFAVSDVFLIKAILAAPLKAVMKEGISEGLTKYFGVGMSNEFGASVSRWKGLGLDMSGYKHHWLITQAMMEDYPFLKPIGNQTWNLTRFESQASHMRWAHFKAYPSLGLGKIPGAPLLYPFSSTPVWLRLGVTSYSVKAAQ